MKKYNILVLMVLLFGFGTIYSQSAKRGNCEYCNMEVKDQLHKAMAQNENEVLEFDAIECLINYIKKHDQKTFSSLKVADYKTGDYLNAKTAFYLKSKSIPSPMGAFLSAFENEEEANKVKKEKGGEVYSWKAILEKFRLSDFGVLNHDHHNHYRPDAHAPIGVMGDHLHHKGGLMFSLRYMDMGMEGNRSDGSEVNDDDIYNEFMVAPQQMSMRMYMLGLMYAPTDRLTLMVMQNYVEKQMDLTARMMMNGMTMERDFSTDASGFGDLKVGAMYGLLSSTKNSLHLNTMINIPLGSVEKRHYTPMMTDAKLPYAMQLGSGTVDLSLGATYKKSFKTVSLGSQLLGTVRTGKNSENYRLGNLYQLNAWGAYTLSRNFSLSVRFLGTSEGKIEGEDGELNPNMVTTASTDNYGGEEIRSFVGLNIAFTKNPFLRRARFGIEAGTPLYQNYAGIQMDRNLTLNVGLKYDLR